MWRTGNGGACGGGGHRAATPPKPRAAGAVHAGEAVWTEKRSTPDLCHPVRRYRSVSVERAFAQLRRSESCVHTSTVVWNAFSPGHGGVDCMFTHIALCTHLVALLTHVAFPCSGVPQSALLPRRLCLTHRPANHICHAWSHQSSMHLKKVIHVLNVVPSCFCLDDYRRRLNTHQAGHLWQSAVAATHLQDCCFGP
eukprot:42908-Chlamydomonas_euryale.AAC.3